MKVVIIGSGLGAYLTAKAIREKSKSCEIVIVTKSDGCFYSKPMLSNACKLNKPPEKLIQKSALQMEQAYNIKVKAHTTVKKINPEKKAISTEDSIIHFDKLIIATGSITANHNHGDEIISINNLEDYKKAYHHIQNKDAVTIIGAGLVGTEFACDLNTFGIDVTLVHNTSLQ